MKRLNNKGYMLVEIILASVLAMVVAYFVTDLTIKLKNKNDDLLVKTLVSTDQAIIYNTIMKDLYSDSSTFSCSDISVNENVFKYKNFTNVVSDYAVLGKVDCDTFGDNIKIYIPISVKQMPEEYFNINIMVGQQKYSESILNGADPVLDEGMIPVTISEDGIVTTADIKNAWYNYGNKQWANAVLVKEDGNQTRDYYKNNIGKTVNQDDILAYYVWIPRYKYAFPNADGNPEEISIVFEAAGTAKSTGTAKGASYYTHPAFTFGTQELSGIWVGKFETGHSSLSSSATNNNLGCSNENCTSADGLIIKPNVQSLGYNNILNFFYASRSMTRSTNPFGLDASTTDSHMIKNSEWGAVAYLSHSKYGINQEIYINNSSGRYTGRSGGNVGGSAGTGTYGTYTWTGQEINSSGTIGSYATDRTLGTNASTTGNVTGVYDMSGGSWEYAMGNYGNQSSSCGVFPNSEYYNLYSHRQFVGDRLSNLNSCTLGTCGGHALNESVNWYGDTVYFVDSNYNWFIRGGYVESGINSGVFCSGFNDGCNTSGDNASRMVLVARNVS